MRHRRALRIFINTALILLVSLGAAVQSMAADAQSASLVKPPAGPTDAESCVGIGDVFQLDVPGRYVAFAVGSSGPLSTEVRGSHGQWLATSSPTTLNAAPVDLPSGLRFDITPPQVFGVESSVLIHVRHDNAPYELVLVRLGDPGESSGLDIRPPVEHVVNESGSCLIGDLHDTFKIHTDAVYSDAGARQVFLVQSPNRAA